MKKYYFLLFLFCAFASCKMNSTLDLGFTNQMQAYEPKFMELSEKVSYVDRNLSVTDLRYPKDLAELSKYSGSDASFQGNYRNMMAQRDAIRKEFTTEKQKFSKLITDFNDFRNRVMQNQVNGEEAKKEFDGIMKNYGTSITKLDDVKQRIVHNIEDHNRLTRNLALSVNVYTNFNIDPH
ncbi:MAG: hypothetical protein ACKVTZ_16660 [Bacteroidia bacterium]